jgi:DNA replication protein DnaC
MPALAIDDVGMGTMDTNWENSILERIIVERYERRLLTVITTNKHIETFPERVVARFKDKTTTIIVVNRAGNYREVKGVSANTKS